MNKKSEENKVSYLCDELILLIFSFIRNPFHNSIPVPLLFSNITLIVPSYRGLFEYDEKEMQNKVEITIDNCDICYEVKRLHKMCNVCNHPFCLDCLHKIANMNMNCAFCRS
jgi:hypothetical protein